MAKPRGPARQDPERPESQASASRPDQVRAPGLKLPLQATASSATALPAALRTLASRADGSDSAALLPNLKVRRTLELAPASRSADGLTADVDITNAIDSAKPAQAIPRAVNTEAQVAEQPAAPAEEVHAQEEQAPEAQAEEAPAKEPATPASSLFS